MKIATYILVTILVTTLPSYIYTSYHISESRFRALKEEKPMDAVSPACHGHGNKHHFSSFPGTHLP